MMRNGKRQRGFTLLEMMVSLAIGAIVISPLYIITRGMGEQTDSQRMEIEAMQRARLGLAILTQDFNRVGLSVSPNTLADTKCADKDIGGSTARVRSAMVHLNREQAGNDAIMVSGNFLGSKTYNAYAIGSNQIQLQNVLKPSECVEQFDKNFAFAHVMNQESGMTLDARVTATEHKVVNGIQTCDLTLMSGDLGGGVIKQGEYVSVSANQTAVYWVETVEGRNKLVRYFINYNANDMPADCNISGVTTPSGLDSVIPGAIVPATRQVIADYVENFQVWLRPVEMVNNATVPHYDTITNLVNAGGVDGLFANGFLLPESDCVFPPSASSNTSNIMDVSCAQSGYTYGAEDLRSAVMLLSVRNEMTDQSIDITTFTQTDRLIRHSLRAYTGLGDRPGACYKLKTVVTEVPLVNIASKKDII